MPQDGLSSVKIKRLHQEFLCMAFPGASVEDYQFSKVKNPLAMVLARGDQLSYAYDFNVCLCLPTAFCSLLPGYPESPGPFPLCWTTDFVTVFRVSVLYCGAKRLCFISRTPYLCFSQYLSFCHAFQFR